MAQANVDLVRRILPGDIDMVALVSAEAPFPEDVLALFEPGGEIRFLTNAPGVPDLSFHGLEGFVEGWRDWLAPFDRYELQVRDIVDASDEEVLVLTHVRARTHRDGVTVEHDPGAVFTVRNGRVVRVRFFLERDEAFAAVGRAQA
jgi:ketosteroid isomerase-like protein